MAAACVAVRFRFESNENSFWSLHILAANLVEFAISMAHSHSRKKHKGHNSHKRHGHRSEVSDHRHKSHKNSHHKHDRRHHRDEVDHDRRPRRDVRRNKPKPIVEYSPEYLEGRKKMKGHLAAILFFQIGYMVMPLMLLYRTIFEVVAIMIEDALGGDPYADAFASSDEEPIILQLVKSLQNTVIVYYFITAAMVYLGPLLLRLHMLHWVIIGTFGVVVILSLVLLLSPELKVVSRFSIIIVLFVVTQIGVFLSNHFIGARLSKRWYASFFMLKLPVVIVLFVIIVVLTIQLKESVKLIFSMTLAISYICVIPFIIKNFKYGYKGITRPVGTLIFKEAFQDLLDGFRYIFKDGKILFSIGMYMSVNIALFYSASVSLMQYIMNIFIIMSSESGIIMAIVFIGFPILLFFIMPLAFTKTVSRSGTYNTIFAGCISIGGGALVELFLSLASEQSMALIYIYNIIVLVSTIAFIAVLVPSALGLVAIQFPAKNFIFVTLLMTFVAVLSNTIATMISPMYRQVTSSIMGEPDVITINAPGNYVLPLIFAVVAIVCLIVGKLRATEEKIRDIPVNDRAVAAIELEARDGDTHYVEEIESASVSSVTSSSSTSSSILSESSVEAPHVTHSKPKHKSSKPRLATPSSSSDMSETSVSTSETQR
eukprot:gnl/Chilomastix_cuspidata/258.p1 GENE.gnl/Chilomastix_cuspidata/258~~gnl/Chilomastix_cuspidata/258.p1  ORF type:complete len:656 (-),score=242.03 gnl/Chilomastix_cuspidata/258:100-2067(-)